MTWETVDDSNGTTARMAVPGGWLYRSVWRARQSGMMMMDAAGLVFVPGDIAAEQITADYTIRDAMAARAADVAETPSEPEVAASEPDAPPIEPAPEPASTLNPEPVEAV